MTQKIIVLALALDVILSITAFCILLFDKKNSAYFLSRNLKSFVAGRPSKTRIVKSALFFIDFVMYSFIWIILRELYNLHYFSPAILILIGLAIIILGLSFPFYFLKTVVWAKKICKV